MVGREGLTGPLYGKLGGGGLEGREREEQGGVQREPKVRSGGGSSGVGGGWWDGRPCGHAGRGGRCFVALFGGSKRAGSGVEWGNHKRGGRGKCGRQEGPGKAEVGAGSPGPVGADGAGQWFYREKWIQVSSGWARSEGGCSAVCCDGL